MRRTATPMLCSVVLTTGRLPVQGAVPDRGTWGVEGGPVQTGALLKFRSPSSAWLVGANGSYTYRDNGSSGSFGGQDQTAIAVRVGLRTYRDVADRTRLFRTLSLIAFYGEFGFSNTSLGAGAEMGIQRFFLPNLSAGVASDLSLLVSRDEDFSTSGPSTYSTSVRVTFTGFRLVAAVFF